MSRVRQLVSSGSPFEPTIGFSRAVRVGDRVLVAGTAPVYPDGSCPPDAVAQTERCLAIIAEALNSAGSSLADVVRTRIYLVDGTAPPFGGAAGRGRAPAVDARDADAVGRAHGAAFGSIRPAATMVAALLDPRWRVEIEAEAIVGAGLPDADQVAPHDCRAAPCMD